jgi:hypothetical protein
LRAGIVLDPKHSSITGCVELSKVSWTAGVKAGDVHDSEDSLRKGESAAHWKQVRP